MIGDAREHVAQVSFGINTVQLKYLPFRSRDEWFPSSFCDGADQREVRQRRCDYTRPLAVPVEAGSELRLPNQQGIGVEHRPALSSADVTAWPTPLRAHLTSLNFRDAAADKEFPNLAGFFRFPGSSPQQCQAVSQGKGKQQAAGAFGDVHCSAGF
jgi:hypothetical protein